MVGIDDLAFYVPELFLEIETLAQARDLPLEKLRYGLGLEKMAIPYPDEDAATMAAEAVWQLIQRNQLDPRNIGRIYLGTESAWDGAKPMASYTLEMLENRLSATYGVRCLQNCDVVDLTFACIGAVDALQNTLDWAAAKSDRIGIVVAADYAKYELGSGGEYTQGAGAVALLVRQNPRLLSLDTDWGVATHSVHDFHKPKRRATKEQIIQEVLTLAELDHLSAAQLTQKLYALNGSAGEILGGATPYLHLFKETPLFDGQFSNQCYQDRIKEAFEHFKKQHPNFKLSNWKRIALHLPYAKHGERVFQQIFAGQQDEFGQALQDELQMPFTDTPEYYRAVAKSKTYKTYSQSVILPGSLASAQIGNMYTASIFMALISLLDDLSRQGAAQEGDTIGFIAYGSGSKAKVFAGVLQPNWQKVAASLQIMEYLQNQRKAIGYQTYLDYHEDQKPVRRNRPFTLQTIDAGQRIYQ